MVECASGKDFSGLFSPFPFVGLVVLAVSGPRGMVPGLVVLVGCCWVLGLAVVGFEMNALDKHEHANRVVSASCRSACLAGLRLAELAGAVAAMLLLTV